MQLFAKRNRQPSNQVSSAATDPNPIPAVRELAWSIGMKGSAVLRSFGPLSNAMEAAPATQVVVPKILALVLHLLMFTVSNLYYVGTCMVIDYI